LVFVRQSRRGALCDPFRFDIARVEPAHLGFGIGQHFCLGARLAELQLRIFFAEFLKRLPQAAPSGPTRRMRSSFVASITSMPRALVLNGLRG
jgi:linalool 8-monooxygenase